MQHVWIWLDVDWMWLSPLSLVFNMKLLPPVKPRHPCQEQRCSRSQRLASTTLCAMLELADRLHSLVYWTLNMQNLSLCTLLKGEVGHVLTVLPTVFLSQSHLAHKLFPVPCFLQWNIIHVEPAREKAKTLSLHIVKPWDGQATFTTLLHVTAPFGPQKNFSAISCYVCVGPLLFDTGSTGREDIGAILVRQDLLAPETGDRTSLCMSFLTTVLQEGFPFKHPQIPPDTNFTQGWRQRGQNVGKSAYQVTCQHTSRRYAHVDLFSVITRCKIMKGQARHSWPGKWQHSEKKLGWIANVSNSTPCSISKTISMQ